VVPNLVLEKLAFDDREPREVLVDRSNASTHASFEAAIAAAATLSQGKDLAPALVFRAQDGFEVAPSIPRKWDDSVIPWNLEGRKALPRAVHGSFDVEDPNLVAVVDGKVVERFPDLRKATIAAFIDAPLAFPRVRVNWEKNVSGPNAKPKYEPRVWEGSAAIHAEAIRSADETQLDIPFRSVGLDEAVAIERAQALSQRDSNKRTFVVVKDETGSFFTAPIGIFSLPGGRGHEILALEQPHAGLVALVDETQVVRP
jgi:hypothetical protein